MNGVELFRAARGCGNGKEKIYVFFERAEGRDRRGEERSEDGASASSYNLLIAFKFG